jgi:hypothetical protein
MTTERKFRARLAGVLLVVPIVAVAYPAAAEAACGGSGTEGNCFVGGQSQLLSTTFGARAVIDIPAKAPSVAASNHFTDPWVMVTDGSHYAQIGFGIDYLGSTSPRYIGFTQYTNSGSTTAVTTRVFAAPALGSSHEFGAAYDSGIGAISMKMSGVQYAQTNYNPLPTWSANWQGQFYNEASNTNLAAWGTSTDKVLWHGVEKKDSAGNWALISSWHATSSDSANWNVGTYSPSEGGIGMRTWDVR